MMKRRTAFLLPVYNPTRESLARTLASLQTQAEPADIIIVDDGSAVPVSDLTTAENGLILLRLERNQGITAALNHGLDYIMTHGYEFVARMDCGDIATADRVLKQRSYMDAHPAVDLVGAFADIVDERGRHLFFEGTSGGRPAITRKLMDNAAFKHPTFFLRTSCIERFGLYSSQYPHAEDYELMRRVHKMGEIDCIADVLLTYEKSDSSISSRNRFAQLWSRLRIQLKYFDVGKIAAYVGVARSIVTLLVPARIWTRLSRLYWRRSTRMPARTLSPP